VVGTGKLAPSGWHVPTDAEWTTLTTYLGGLTVAGGKLKESGTTHWLAPNTEATNESGFTALPGGHRSSSGDFYYVGIFGYWWPASAFDATRSWYRKLNYNSAGVSRFYDNVRDGFSVRLVQDIPVSRHGFVNFQGPGVF